MWKIKFGEGANDPLLYSTNNFHGRQTWAFDPNAGTSEERAKVEAARENFYQNRFKVASSSDLLWRFQFLKDKNFEQTIPPVKVEDGEVITHEKTVVTETAAVVNRTAVELAAVNKTAEITDKTAAAVSHKAAAVSEGEQQ